MNAALCSLKDWRSRVHARVCIPACECTCPDAYDELTLVDARRRAVAVHKKFGHSGTVERCLDEADSICKAVFP